MRIGFQNEVIFKQPLLQAAKRYRPFKETALCELSSRYE